MVRETKIIQTRDPIIQALVIMTIQVVDHHQTAITIAEDLQVAEVTVVEDRHQEAEVQVEVQDQAAVEEDNRFYKQ